ncbi:MAG: hypothetical protein IPM53_27010 [Anaerolineaceae bacterium]|nr:hypothetical protein [Anaerolineaceae bacterium]
MYLSHSTISSLICHTPLRKAAQARRTASSPIPVDCKAGNKAPRCVSKEPLTNIHKKWSMARLVPMGKLVTIAIRADIVGSVTGGMFWFPFWSKVLTNNMPPIFFFVTFHLAESRGEWQMVNC